MKEILMSIRPQWCEKIFNGSKTIEVRKSRPSIPTPFKVYVYQTKIRFKVRDWQENFQSIIFTPNGGAEDGNGKVIGSFVCDKIEEIEPSAEWSSYGYDTVDDDLLKEMRLERGYLEKYGAGVTLYGWHITSPKLFEKPRDITEFAVFGKCADECSEYDFCARDIAEDRVTCKCFKRTFLKRPPRSWCYVEGE